MAENLNFANGAYSRDVSAKQQVDVADKNLDAIIKDTLTRQELHIGGHFTGPKGVLADFNFHKSLEMERAKESLLKQSASLSDVALSSGWMEEQLKQESQGSPSNVFPVVLGPEDTGDDPTDKVLEQWRTRRLEELAAMPALSRKTFGKVVTLSTQDEFLQAIDYEPVTTFVIIHLYENSNPASQLVNSYLPRLAKHYPYHKFATIKASTVDPSIDIAVALPVIQCYRRGELVANLVKFTEDMSIDNDRCHFEWEDLEDLLMRNGIISMEDLVQPTSDSSEEALAVPML